MSASPFSVLGLPPTLDPAAVKRAYFAALARHPPHAAPEAFRLVRAAYEQLRTLEGLAAAFLDEPIDLRAELDRLEAPFLPALAAAGQEDAAERGATEAGARLIDALSPLPLAEALRRFGGAGATGG